MSEPIAIPLSAGQVTEFAELARQEAAAKQTLEHAPIARNYAARAIVLASYDLAQFDGQNLHIDLAAATITFTPNGPQAAP